MNRRSFMRLVAGVVVGGVVGAAGKSEPKYGFKHISEYKGSIEPEFGTMSDMRFITNTTLQELVHFKLKWSSVGSVADWSSVNIFA